MIQLKKAHLDRRREYSENFVERLIKDLEILTVKSELLNRVLSSTFEYEKINDTMQELCWWILQARAI